MVLGNTKEFDVFRNLIPSQILNSSKLKDFAGVNFKMGENGKNVSKSVENTAGKGENAPFFTDLLCR